MNEIEKARQLFREAGLAFPTIPEELAVQLKERHRWLFSTRPIDVSPYNLFHALVRPEEAARRRSVSSLPARRSVRRVARSAASNIPCTCSICF